MGALSTGKTQYKEFRGDGWPLCPQCKEDELWSRLLWTGYDVAPTMEEYIRDGLQCYRCQWQSVEILHPYAIRVTGLDRLIANLNPEVVK